MASSDTESTLKRKRESSPTTQSSLRKRMREFSPTMAPSLSSSTSTMAPSLSSATISAMASSTMTVSQALGTVLETGQFKQEDNDTVPEAEPENAQEQDNDNIPGIVDDNIPAYDYNTDESANEDTDMDTDDEFADEYIDIDAEGDELPAPAPAPSPSPALDPEHWRLIRVVSRLTYQEHSQEVVANSFVGAIYADTCNSWFDLSERIRRLYFHVADPEALGYTIIQGGNVAPPLSWPGRIVQFYSTVDGEVVERIWPQNDWEDLDLANNLDLITLIIPQDRECRIVEGLGDGLDGRLLSEIVIQELTSWEVFAALIREEYYMGTFDKLPENLEVVPELSPLNCCPGEHVTFWSDLKEQWFYGRSTRNNNHGQDNWTAARKAICKVMITEIDD